MERTFFIKAIAIVAAVCCALGADAFQFQKDGIYYKFIDNNKVEVTYKDDKHKCYSGKVVIPEKVPYEGNYYDVTAIGSEAFMNCPELTAVTIPNSITHIYDGAFHGCKGLKEIRIPASVRFFGKYALIYCTGLTSIIIDPDNTVFDSRNNCNAVIRTSNNSLMAGCKNTIIPNTVVSIQEYAFANQTDIKSIVIPNSVVFIDSRAFVYCKGLESVTIPNSVTTISTAAFYGCEGLKTLALGNSLNRILEDAFKRCSNLTSVTFPKSLTYIGNEAFGECTNLKVVTCKASTPPQMHLYTFDENTNKNATLRVPNAKKSVYQADKYWDDFKSISGYSMIRGKNINYLTTSKYRAEVTYTKEAKSRCTGQVKIPAKVHNYIKVTAIGDFAFSDCAKITSVIIGPEVKTIGARAFENCSRLRTIKCTATTPPVITPDSFYRIPKRVKFFVPKASLPAYKKAPYWKNFSFSTY